MPRNVPSLNQTRLAIACIGCGNLNEREQDNRFETDDGQRICWDCYDNVFCSCTSCEDMYWQPMRWLGSSANEQHARIRANIEVHAASLPLCEGRVRLGQDSDEWTCESCTYTCECGAWYTWESSYQECCRNSDLIHNYSWTPTFRFHSMAWENMVIRNSYPEMGKLYMGFEIEVERAYDALDDWYNDAKEDFHDPEFIYCKSDGSLSSDGVEFVTMPATLEAFEHVFPWNAFVNLRENGARGWAYSNCGMHIHVSRTAFSPSHLYKFVRFQLENSDMCIDFAQRHVHWGSWNNDTMVDAKKRTSVYTKRPMSGARYSAINLSNWATIELRYFKSNILPDGIRRNAQWVQALYDYTKQLPSKQVMSQGWQEAPFVEFLASDAKYQLASKYLKRVRSTQSSNYVPNDRVLDPEEVEF